MTGKKSQRFFVFVFLLETNSFIQQGNIKLIIISDSKDMYYVTKDSISNKCFSFKHSIQKKILRNKMYLSFHRNMNCCQH